MSEKKKKIKKIIISVLIIALIATAVCVFLVTKNKKNKKDSSSTIIPVSQNSTIESQISSDVINQKVCAEYNGNYIYYSFADITFTESISKYDEIQIYQSIAGSNINDKNSFIHYLNNKNNHNYTKESITLVNGKYTRSIGQTMIENGLFFGNLDKSIIFLKNPNGQTIIDEKNYSPSFEISQTGYWLSKPLIDSFNKLKTNDNLDFIFVREKIFYGNNIQKYFYVTYAYQMI